MNEMKEWAKGALQGEAMTYLKGLSTKVKQIALNLSDIEVQVEEATSLEPWGPHGSAMADITRASYDIESYRQIMSVVARRLQSEGAEWRHVYKSLLLLEYMAKHGPQKVVEELVSNVGVIEKLASFQHKDANGKDWGLNVRERARQLAALVTDPERIRSERDKAKANAAKYTGVSSDEMRSSGFGRTSFGGGGLGGGGLGSSSGGGGSSRYGGFGSTGGGIGGSSGGGGVGKAASYDDDNEAKDPREATRERIERLKDQYREADADGIAGGAITAPAAAPTRHGASRPPRLAGGDAVASEAAPPRGPKKLSDVRVNPSIAASLGTLPLPAAAPRPVAPAASASSNAVADLLGGLNGAAPPPAAPPPAARSAPDLLGGLGGAGAVSEGSAGGWDAFAAAGAVPAPGAAWPAVQAVPRVAQPSAAALDDPFGLDAPAAAPAAPALREGDPFAGASLGGAVQPPAAQSPSVAGGGGRGALPQDLFSFGPPTPAQPASLSSLPISTSQPPLGASAAPGGSFGPFGAAAAPAFGSMALAQPAAAALGPVGRPSLGLGAPGADPFAQPPAPAPGFVAFPDRPVQVGPGVGKSVGNMANLPAPAPAKKDPFADLAF